MNAESVKDRRVALIAFASHATSLSIAARNTAASGVRAVSADPGDLGAGRALIPIYEVKEKWARLPALHELCLAAEEDPDVKSAWLQKQSDRTGNRLVVARGRYRAARPQPSRSSA